MGSIMCILFFALMTSSVYSFGDLLSEWKSFKVNFNKQYSSPMEEQRRMGIFGSELKRVSAFNAEKHSYSQGINFYSDYTDAEYNSLLMDSSTINQTKSLGFEIFQEDVKFTKQAPESKNWVEEEMVSEVKMQGQCGSCWAFATVATIESCQLIAGKVPSMVELSEQHLVDCHKKSCQGENVKRTFGYIQRNGGITTRSQYPYTSGRTKKAGTCKEKKNALSGKIRGFQQVRREDQLAETIANVGPVAVTMCWLGRKMGSYRGGVFYDRECDSSSCNSGYHAVSAVGYGNDPDGGDYWLIKNSHDKSFGEEGYLRLRRGINHCKIDTELIYPVF